MIPSISGMIMNEITSHRKRVANAIRNVVGGQPKMIPHVSQRGGLGIHLLEQTSAPQGTHLFSTVGLHEYDFAYRSVGDSVRVELLAEFDMTVEGASSFVSTCAFTLIEKGLPITPDTVVRNVASEIWPGTAMRHAFIVDPYSFRVETIRFDSLIVTWLQVLPISDSEFEYARTKGAGALRELLQAADAKVYAVDRPSVV